MTSAETGTAPESAAVSTAKSDFAIDTEQQSLRELVRAYLGRFRDQGKLGLALARAQGIHHRCRVNQLDLRMSLPDSRNEGLLVRE